SLTRVVSSLTWNGVSQWSRYDSDQPSYSEAAMASKLATVATWLDRGHPHTVWDLGANTGRFALMAAARGSGTIALDRDAACIERLYQTMRAERLPNLLPLVSDVTRPSAATGWANRERQTLAERGTADLLLVLAL